jgi:hypothetical protein
MAANDLVSFTHRATLCCRSAALMSARATFISAERAQWKLAARSARHFREMPRIPGTRPEPA